MPVFYQLPPNKALSHPSHRLHLHTVRSALGHPVWPKPLSLLSPEVLLSVFCSVVVILVFLAGPLVLILSQPSSHLFPPQGAMLFLLPIVTPPTRQGWALVPPPLGGRRPQSPHTNARLAWTTPARALAVQM